MLVESLMLKMGPDEIADNAALFGSSGLGLDSIDALELVVALEKRFGVKVGDSATAKVALASVDAMADFVSANRTK